MKCKTREWKDYDIIYWESYGISLKWLKYAEVYPISHKIVEKDGKKYNYLEVTDISDMPVMQKRYKMENERYFKLY